MVHAIEAYCVPDFHPLCDGLALEGLRLVVRWLPIAMREPENLDARGAMLVGSCLAGIAFTKGLGLVHAISHMIGAEYDTQHGLTNAVLLPAVLRHNAQDISAKVEHMARIIGLGDTSFDAFHRRICTLLDEVGIPVKLTDIGVEQDCASRIARKAMQDSAASTNLRVLTEPEVESVIQYALTVGR